MINVGESYAPRIVIYAQDGLGLGHMRRTNSIAGHFLRMRPDACVLTLSDSPLGQFFQSGANHDYLKLPSIVKAGPGDWRASRLPVPFTTVYEMRKELICNTVMSFRPHLLLVDHMPHGAMGELLPALRTLKESGLDAKIILGLRDILDTPETVEHRWQVEGAYAALETYYDRVLVYGMRDVFNMADRYHFSPTITERLRYCGYVCPPDSPQPGAAIKARYLNGAYADARLVVAMAGGGADAYPMMQTLLDALPLVQAHRRCRLVLVTGPFMPPELRKDLERRASGQPVRILTAVNDTGSLLAAADLVVAMAGYNTTVEILQAGKRAILIPRRGPSAEQRMRAQLFAARGWVDMLDLDDASGSALATMILANLERGANQSTLYQPDLRGLSATTEQLLSLLPCKMFQNGAMTPVLA
jgi:predicted glycosyltransferase